VFLIYCKIVDSPKEVADYVCKSNFGVVNSEKKSQVINDGSEDDCWIIETDDSNETSALTYRVGNEIVAMELDENCASNVIEPLMKKYGFENIKWLVIK